MPVDNQPTYPHVNNWKMTVYKQLKQSIFFTNKLFYKNFFKLSRFLRLYNSNNNKRSYFIYI